MGLLEELKDLGVDVEEAVARLNGKEALYIKFLGSFAKEITECSISPDFDKTECREAADKAHSIKGVSANMSVTPLYQAYSRITDLLREEKTEEARDALLEILPVQEKILCCIEKYTQ